MTVQKLTRVQQVEYSPCCWLQQPTTALESSPRVCSSCSTEGEPVARLGCTSSAQLTFWSSRYIVKMPVESSLVVPRAGSSSASRTVWLGTCSTPSRSVSSLDPWVLDTVSSLPGLSGVQKDEARLLSVASVSLARNDQLTHCTSCSSLPHRWILCSL